MLLGFAAAERRYERAAMSYDCYVINDIKYRLINKMNDIIYIDFA